MNRFNTPGRLIALASAFLTSTLTISAQNSVLPLQKALTLHASFDKGFDADFAKGDKRLFTCFRPGNQSEAKPGLNADGKTQRIASGGVAGGALRFTARDSKWIFFPGEKNVDFASADWSGTVSVWLQLDPEEDLDPGFTDPIQITPRKWNDAAFFVDFDKDGDPRDFRLGAFADLKVWNAKNENVNDIPEDKRPLVKVVAPPFSRDKWTHVVFSWERFNSGKKDGVAKFYLDGKLRGEIAGWKQTFSWSDSEEVRLFLGLNYIGLLDELSCFNRALSQDEVKQLYGLKSQISTIIPKE
jgi:hypothetical protein